MGRAIAEAAIVVDPQEAATARLLSCSLKGPMKDCCCTRVEEARRQHDR